MNHRFKPSALKLTATLLIAVGSGGPSGPSRADTARGLASATVVAPVRVGDAVPQVMSEPDERLFVSEVVGDVRIHVAVAQAGEAERCVIIGGGLGACAGWLNASASTHSIARTLEVGAPENGFVRVTVAYN